MESLNISFQRVIDAGMFTGQWRESNISNLVNVLECFHRASGLKINMSKSKILGINVETAKIKQAAVQLGCLILNAPFTYLGAQVENENLVYRLADVFYPRQSLGSMSLFDMSIFKVPSSVLKRLESIRSRFFRGHDIGSNKAAWVKWSDATSLWARVIKAIHGVDGNIGRHITSGNRSCWTSIISEAEVLKQQETNEEMSVGEKLKVTSLESTFRRKPRGGIEQSQYEELVHMVIDAKQYVGGKSSTRWVKYVPIKVNVMAWKIKLDAIPTRINMSRRGIDLDSLSCPICECGIESVGHLFFQCQVVRQVVRKISFWWNVDYVDFNSYEEWLNWLISLRLTAKYKELLEGVFYVLWWLIWSFRNKIIFEAKPPSKAVIFDNVWSQFFLWYKLLFVGLLDFGPVTEKL
ncbi:RNA-directed DNA polymerase, eukaryota, reverse transcriptase zinc-binding domain protein [Tanacetum coccineum]